MLQWKQLGVALVATKDEATHVVVYQIGQFGEAAQLKRRVSAHHLLQQGSHY